MARFFSIFVRVFQNRYSGNIFEVIKHFPDELVNRRSIRIHPSHAAKLWKYHSNLKEKGSARIMALRKRMTRRPLGITKYYALQIATFVIESPIIVLLRGSMSYRNNTVTLYPLIFRTKLKPIIELLSWKKNCLIAMWMSQFLTIKDNFSKTLVLGCKNWDISDKCQFLSCKKIKVSEQALKSQK